MRKPLPKHWYKRYIYECPLCGRTIEIRERQFTPKPKDYVERVRYNGMAYDWCQG